MLITPAMVGAAGQVLGGIGSIASAFSGGDDRDVVGDALFNRTMQLDLNQRTMDQKMAMAKQHGLHPLTVLGMPAANFSPVYSSGGGRDSGADLSAIGYGANQISKAFVKPPEEDPLERRAVEANVRLLEAQAKRAEWEALGSEFSVADYAAGATLRGQPGNPPGVRMSNDVAQMEGLAARQAGIPLSYFSSRGGPIDIEQKILPPHPSQLGHAAGADQAHITVFDSHGKPTSMLNQNAVQAEFNDGATMTWLTKRFGLERATEIMAALEQKGLIGGVAAAIAAGGKLWYDRMAAQRAEALKRRPRNLPGRGRGSWKASGRGGD